MFTTKAAHWGTRSGALAINGKEIATPNFIVSTTRGAIPHLTPDHETATPVAGVYAEDLWDAHGLVEACVSHDRLPFRSDLVLASIRRPGSRLITNKPNTIDSLGIDTIQGSRLAPISALTKFMSLIHAEIFVVPYDIPSQSKSGRVGHNRTYKMEVRSLDWMEKFHKTRQDPAKTMLVATIPLELAKKDYLDRIDPKCDAYTFTTTEAVNCAREFANASKLRLSERVTTNWAEVLEEIKLGSDLVYIPLTEYADAGKALTLRFSGETAEYVDLHDSVYATDTTPLGSVGHSLAYIHHLLKAEEMTAQVLLQLHNHQVVTRLFEDVRVSIEKGRFDGDVENFLKKYH